MKTCILCDQPRHDERKWCKAHLNAHRRELYITNPSHAEGKRRSSRKWKHNNPEKLKDYKLRINHGITLEQYNAILVEQNGVCAICGGTSSNCKLAVDHDHDCCPTEPSCGKCIRGLLCSNCNLGIGYFNDDPGRLDACADYLESA